MKYNFVKNADEIISSSKYTIKSPEKYKGKYKELFGNNNPICLEIGMGRGSFIMQMARKNPKVNYIGLELDNNQLAYMLQNIKSDEYKNLKVIHGDAGKVCEYFSKEIDTIYLTFPEPWPKGIDEKKRLTNISYLKLYDRIFKKNKHIILKTDNKILYQSSLENLSEYWYTFNKVSVDLHNDERHIDNVMTDFEKEYYKTNRQIYYVDAKFNE